MKTIAQTAVLMSILTLGSKLLGFLREMVMAGLFGANYITDAYVMAQTIPSIIFAGIFGSIAIAYMPLYSKKIEKEGNNSANLFTSQILNILLITSIFSSVLGIFFSNAIVGIFARGFQGEVAQLTSFYIKVTFSYVVFSSVASILDSYLQYKNVFLQQIIIGYAQNIIIIGVIIISAYTTYYFLIFGLLIGYIIRAILIWLLANRKEYKYYFKFNIKETLKVILPLTIPVFIGSSFTQINMFVDKSLASGLKEGSVAALNYATLLNTMVLALSVSILTTIVYPKITQAYSLNDNQKLNSIIQRSFTVIYMIALPFSMGAILYSKEIVQIVFERGAFNSNATYLTETAYMYYSIGLLFMAINELLIRIYYSKQDMKSPMLFSAVCVFINIILSLIFIKSMGHNGLALATSIATISNSVLLYLGIKKHTSINIIQSKIKIFKITVAATLSIIISYIVYLFINSLFVDKIIILKLGLTIILAIIIYLILLKILNIKEITNIKQIIFKQ
ncbi:murein biosynthesis integral membrane protein MurJ [Sinanaerobacter chloroacetimidivorans]|uniref:Probable lipid II flippase MurJ n=1 Tax=Sinanaerobacter chloroacetimidivorans TaxID=2818044 RepID=A0A8J7W2Z4_9FIRM|nr:murein biosynthesis integral membrane protein MurJ [Sinanaerobacter chloroacetimidivorans]MBR0599524.1 murein biosynthesis integral membrane protein MurJ [Sinanaerobacter chloroacetimidivorans]